MKNKKGFTLIEMLVVVLIIGILAAVALPQYQNAVLKAKVSAILPIMRRWKDAIAEYKLQNGTYCKVGQDECEDWPDGSDLGVSWPSSWKSIGSNEPCGDVIDCSDGFWDCYGGGYDDGSLECVVYNNLMIRIVMTQPDSEDICGGNQGKTVCVPLTPELENKCIKLGKPSGENDDGMTCTIIGG